MAQNIDVSIIPQSYLPEIKVSENDNSLRVIRVSIIDENGEAYQIPSGVTATFAGTKPSGLGFTVPCTIDGSVVQFVMEDTVCNEAGRFPAEIRLINGEARIGTCNVLMSVEPNPHPDDTTDGDREPLVNEITALLHAIEEQAEQVAEDTRIVEQAMDAWTNMSATAETLPAGSEASASYSNGVLSLGIPKGDKGDQGAKGDPGATGATPDLQIGTVETLDPGEDATATITGTPEEPILSMGIPQGEKGDPGDVTADGVYPDLIAGGLVSDERITDTAPYLFRKSFGGPREYDTIIGATVNWNQLANINKVKSGTADGITYSATGNGYITLNGTAASSVFNTDFGVLAGAMTNGHVYFTALGNISTDSNVILMADGWTQTFGSNRVKKATRDVASGKSVYVRISGGYTINGTYPVKIIDLTSAFGTEIAEKVLTMETATTGSGIAWLRSYGFLTKDYYEYCQPRLESVRVSGHETTGRNLFDKGNYNVINGYIDNNAIFSSGASRSVVRIKCLPNTTYTISRKAIASNERFGFGWTTETPAVGVSVYDVTGMSMSTTVGTTMTRTLTTGANAKYLAIWMGWENRNAEAETMQIEFGSTATDYEEFISHTYPLDSSLILMGLLKLDANNNIYADGDIYPADGNGTSNYYMVNLGDLRWVPNGNYQDVFNGDLTVPAQTSFGQSTVRSISDKYIGTDNTTVISLDKSHALSNTGLVVYLHDSAYTDATALKTALDGVYMVYRVANPTLFTADPFTSPQIVDADGTEEYIDYAVEQGLRDVAIPVGHDTEYMVNLKSKLEDMPDIPPVPSSNGTYTLKAVRSNTGVTCQWVTG